MNNNNNIKETLQSIFDNVNEWLKFAEAKNALLIGFIGAALLGVFSSWSSLIPEHQILIKNIFFPCEIIALLISFYSFLPDLDLTERTTKKKEAINLYFFGHLRDLTKNQLLKEIYEPNLPKEYPRIELDLANQIIRNSDITWRKYRTFKISGYISLIGILLPLIIILYHLVCK